MTNLMRPLFGALKGNAPNHVVDWSADIAKAFVDTKKALVNATMLVALRASLKDDSWCDRLPWVLLGIGTTPKEDLQSSSVELVYRQPLRVPGDFIPNASVPWSASLQCSTHLSSLGCCPSISSGATSPRMGRYLYHQR
ncbi:hypothetical protein AAFF_G00209360 [Aldrovandia affinis]|uniref:Uncharacterized protein n=1 Tax=Aldrovandia affinis TaxID=143900 RepID=A0AAD7SWC8_9TELE|nr:hypothetical protein AAFF_G00209360 [Aldrovandia affinis]